MPKRKDLHYKTCNPQGTEIMGHRVSLLELWGEGQSEAGDDVDLIATKKDLDEVLEGLRLV